jgi:hypothetical protein
MLFNKKSLIFAFSALCSALAAPATQPQPPSPKIPTSNKAQRFVTAWLGLPEHQMRPVRYIRNSLPWLAQKGHKKLTNYLEDDAVTPPSDKKSLLQMLHLLIAVPALESLTEKLQTQSALTKRGKREAYLHKSKIFWQMLGTASKHMTNAGNWHVMRAPFYFYQARDLLYELKLRRKALLFVKKNVPHVMSRCVPTAMHGQKYIVLQNPAGFFIRNLPDIFKTTRGLFLCAQNALGILLSITAQETPTTAPPSPGYIPLRAHSARTIHDPKTRASVPQGPSQQTHGLDGLYKTFKNINALLSDTRRLNKHASRGIEPGLTIATQLPWAPHCYILESDLQKLPLASQKTLLDLASKDAFDAVETINNAADWIWKTGHKKPTTSTTTVPTHHWGHGRPLVDK